MTQAGLRRATDDDVDGIVQLVQSAFGKYVERMGRTPAPMLADYDELMRTSRVWVMEDRRELVGVLVTRAHADHLLLDVIAVSPNAQGGGHGLALLGRAERDAREEHLVEIRLCTNEAMTENLEFYCRRGFHETSRGLQDGYRRVFFAKLLVADGTQPKE